MNKKVARILLVMVVMTILFTLFAGTIGLAFTPIDLTPQPVTEVSNFNKLAQTIYSYVFTYGTIVAVIIIAWYGFRYITASAKDKAAIKDNFFTYVVGAIILFGGVAIFKWVAVLIENNVTILR